MAEMPRVQANSEIGAEQSGSVGGLTRPWLVAGTSLGSLSDSFWTLPFERSLSKIQLKQQAAGAGIEAL